MRRSRKIRMAKKNGNANASDEGGVRFAVVEAKWRRRAAEKDEEQNNDEDDT